MTIRLSLFAALVVAASACSSNKASDTGAAPTTNDPVVATYAGKQITLSQLDREIADKLYETRRQGLDQVIMEDLIKSEAKKRGMTEDDYLREEIEKKVPPPSEEQVQQTYDQLKAAGRIPEDAPEAEVKQQIASMMTRPQQQERARAFFNELRQKNNVEIKLQEPLPPKKEVAATGPSKGPKDAPITIVEFSDFQCPFCSRAVGNLEEVMKAYPDKVRLVFRHYPLPFHENAEKAAEAAMCADEQGKFWELHDWMFKNQDKLAVADLKSQVRTMGLDGAKFDSCLDSGKFAELIKKDQDAGSALGVSGTPAFFINGMMLSGARPPEDFKRIIDAELASKK
ncbi:MAG: thioredoxin domain-containing protein [Myxococcaceae bacterium]|nr:thioredoxin domain-containing protein [Myxococcaceae bacterium]